MLKNYINNRFGSKRGFINLCLTEAARRVGRYRDFTQVDFQKVNRLIFICHGNICRSPLGAIVAKTQGASAESFGLDTRGGDSADPRAVAFATQKKMVLSDHITRHINHYSPKPGDLLVGMEPKHTDALRALYHGHEQVQFTLAGLWLENPVAYLHDPYSANNCFFNLCESLVEQSARVLAARVVANK